MKTTTKINKEFSIKREELLNSMKAVFASHPETMLDYAYKNHTRNLKVIVVNATSGESFKTTIKNVKTFLKGAKISPGINTCESNSIDFTYGEQQTYVAFEFNLEGKITEIQIFVD